MTGPALLVAAPVPTLVGFSFQNNISLGTFIILIAVSVSAIFVGSRNKSWRTSSEGWKSAWDQSQEELAEVRGACHTLEVEVAGLRERTDVTAFAKQIEAMVAQFDASARERQEQILECFREVEAGLRANTTALQGLAMQFHATT